LAHILRDRDPIARLENFLTYKTYRELCKECDIIGRLVASSAQTWRERGISNTAIQEIEKVLGNFGLEFGVQMSYTVPAVSVRRSYYCDDIKLKKAELDKSISIDVSISDGSFAAGQVTVVFNLRCLLRDGVMVKLPDGSMGRISYDAEKKFGILEY
jgi:hypothetical protein